MIYAGEIGEEDEETIVLEPLDEPGEVPAEPAIPAVPVPERQPA